MLYHDECPDKIQLDKNYSAMTDRLVVYCLVPCVTCAFIVALNNYYLVIKVAGRVC